MVLAVRIHIKCKSGKKTIIIILLLFVPEMAREIHGYITCPLHISWSRHGRSPRRRGGSSALGAKHDAVDGFTCNVYPHHLRLSLRDGHTQRSIPMFVDLFFVSQSLTTGLVSL